MKKLVRTVRKREEKMTRNQRNITYWKGQRIGMHVDTIEVEMTEHEEDDDYNDKVKIIIETTSGTETQKTADK